MSRLASFFGCIDLLGKAQLESPLAHWKVILERGNSAIITLRLNKTRNTGRVTQSSREAGDPRSNTAILKHSLMGQD